MSPPNQALLPLIPFCHTTPPQKAFTATEAQDQETLYYFTINGICQKDSGGYKGNLALQNSLSYIFIAMKDFKWLHRQTTKKN